MIAHAMMVKSTTSVTRFVGALREVNGPGFAPGVSAAQVPSRFGKVLKI